MSRGSKVRGIELALEADSSLGAGLDGRETQNMKHQRYSNNKETERERLLQLEMTLEDFLVKATLELGLR